MAQRNGYLVITEKDMNPNSNSYLQTREREVYDPVSCPDNSPNYVNTDSYCEIADSETGVFSGRKVLVYTDMNPNSDLYLDTYEEYIDGGAECEPQDTNPIWIEINRECEMKIYQPSGVEGLTNNALVTYIDDNEFSPTSDQERTEIEIDGANCPAPNTDPEWTELNRSCNLVTVNGVLGYDGTATVNKRDDNVYSSSWGSTVTEVVADSACPQTFGIQTIYGSVDYEDQTIDCASNTWTNILTLKQVSTGQLFEITVTDGNLGMIWNNSYNQNYQFISSLMTCGEDSQYDRGYVYVDAVKYTTNQTFILTNNTINLAETD